MELSESPEDVFNDRIYGYFADELKKRNPKMRYKI